MKMKMKRAGLFRSIEKEKKYGGYLFIGPWLIGFAALFVYPFLKTLLLSFADVTGIEGLGSLAVKGGGNYQRAFVADVDFLPMFIEIVGKTVTNTILILVFSLFLALILNKKLPGRGIFRAIFFLPVILGTGTLAAMVTDSSTAASIMAIDEASLASLLDADMAAVVMNLLDALSTIFWHSSVQIVIYLSGLQGISDSLYESAGCDGATAWESFWKITLPMLAPVTVINLIYTIIDSFTSAENKLLSYIHKAAFSDMDFSYSAAMSMIYLGFVFVFTGTAYFLITRRQR